MNHHQQNVRRRYHLAQLCTLLILCSLILFITSLGSVAPQSGSGSVVQASRSTLSFNLQHLLRNNYATRRRRGTAHTVTAPVRQQQVIHKSQLSNNNNNNNNYHGLDSYSIGETPKTENVTYCVPQPEEAVVWDAIQFAKLGASVILVCLSGLFSGLTLGLLGLDKTTLDIIKESGKEQHRKWAARIIPIRRRGNLLLCTLLLGNVMVNTGISVLTTDMTSGIAGFIISSAVITLFGEIIPQATCSRYALAIGAHTFWLVYIFMFLLFPLTFPLSFFLDKVLGKEIGTVYTKEELKKLVEIHVTTLKQESDLLEDEARILGGVLDFGKKTVENIMTPVESTFMLDISEKLDVDTMTKVWQTGHSRIPVYKNNKDNIVGILFTKDLVLINPEEGVPLSTVLTFYGREVIKVFPDTHLDEMLKVFKTGRSHLAIVHDVHTPKFGDPVYQTVGLVSLEDVIEEMIKDEIVDETDVYIDNQSKNRVQRENERIEITLFAGKGKKHRATPKQVIAIGSYLEKTLDLFRCIPEDYLHKLVGSSPIFELDVSSSKTGEDIFLYESGKPADYFSLILTGRVEVLSGKDGFSSEMGMWSYLGIRALSDPKFVPDFSSRVLKNVLFMKISRNDFVEMVSKAYRNNVHNYLPSEIQWIVDNEDEPSSPDTPAHLKKRTEFPSNNNNSIQDLSPSSSMNTLAGSRHRGLSAVGVDLPNSGSAIVLSSPILAEETTEELEYSNDKGALLPKSSKSKRSKRKKGDFLAMDDEDEDDDGAIRGGDDTIELSSLNNV